MTQRRNVYLLGAALYSNIIVVFLLTLDLPDPYTDDDDERKRGVTVQFAPYSNVILTAVFSGGTAYRQRTEVTESVGHELIVADRRP
jgi:hypothetical protein